MVCHGDLRISHRTLVVHIAVIADIDAIHLTSDRLEES